MKIPIPSLEALTDIPGKYRGPHRPLQPTKPTYFAFAVKNGKSWEYGVFQGASDFYRSYTKLRQYRSKPGMMFASIEDCYYKIVKGNPDPEVFKELFNLVYAAVSLLNVVREQKPEMVKDFAHWETEWPVILKCDHSETKNILGNLELGLKLRQWQEKRYSSKVYKEGRVARDYAEHAIDTIRFNADLAIYLHHHRLKWYKITPEWVRKCSMMPSFTRRNLSNKIRLAKWQKLIREVIKTGMPDFFEQDPKWKEIVANLSNYKPPIVKRGEIRKECLDMIIRKETLLAMAPL